MSETISRCVALSNGAISPDLRVNYEFGMVLGVDEFRQEQKYFLEKDYLYNRALHGSGTVYGLNVTADRPPDNSAEVQVTIEPGLAIDQWGRPIVIRNTQCARLGAWVAKQTEQDIQVHTSASGALSV